MPVPGNGVIKSLTASSNEIVHDAGSSLFWGARQERWANGPIEKRQGGVLGELSANEKLTFPTGLLRSNFRVVRHPGLDQVLCCPLTNQHYFFGWHECYLSLAYSTFACLRMGMSGSASFQSAKKS